MELPVIPAFLVTLAGCFFWIRGGANLLAPPYRRASDLCDHADRGPGRHVQRINPLDLGGEPPHLS